MFKSTVLGLDKSKVDPLLMVREFIDKLVATPWFAFTLPPSTIMATVDAKVPLKSLRFNVLLPPLVNIVAWLI
jgi:hypothetical protein